MPVPTGVLFFAESDSLEPSLFWPYRGVLAELLLAPRGESTCRLVSGAAGASAESMLSLPPERRGPSAADMRPSVVSSFFGAAISDRSTSRMDMRREIDVAAGEGATALAPFFALGRSIPISERRRFLFGVGSGPTGEQSGPSIVPADCSSSW